MFNETLEIKPNEDVVIALQLLLQRIIHNQPPEETLVIDFKNIKTINSVVCGLLLALKNQSSIKIKITNCSDEVFGLFKIMRLDKMIEISM